MIDNAFQLIPLRKLLGFLDVVSTLPQEREA